MNLYDLSHSFCFLFQDSLGNIKDVVPEVPVSKEKKTNEVVKVSSSVKENASSDRKFHEVSDFKL